MKMQTKRHMAPFGPSCAQSCFVPRFAQISSYQAKISYVPSTCTSQRRPTKDYNSRSTSTVSSNPLGMAALQRLARDSTPLLNSALISPIIHGRCMCLRVSHSTWMFDANTLLSITPKLLDYWSRGTRASNLYWFSKGAVRLLSRVGQTRVVANPNPTECTNLKLNAAEIQCANL